MEQVNESDGETIVRLSGKTLRQLRSESRAYPLVEVRHVVIYVIRRELGWSLPRIGRFINRHHTSLLNSLDRVEHDAVLHKRAILLQTEFEHISNVEHV